MRDRGIIMYWQNVYIGSFFNYVDKILAIIDHLPTPSWLWWRLLKDKICKPLTFQVPPTNLPRHIVNIVNERPLFIVANILSILENWLIALVL